MLLVFTPTVHALNPESAEVRAAVERAVVYLEANNPAIDPKTTLPPRFGSDALVALATLKAGRGIDHPNVQRGITNVIAVIDAPMGADCVYDLGISILLLVEVDGVHYRTQIQRLHARLISLQKPHGGFGYLNRDTGDTSMSQYAVLGLWAADSVGVSAPESTWVRLTNWLLRCQDPSGSWGYQAVDPDSFSLVPQPNTSPSLAMAAMASLNICADHLALIDRKEDQPEDVPPALKPVGGGKARRRASGQVDVNILKQAIGRGETALAQIAAQPPTNWSFYFIYANERYFSFRELFHGVEQEPEWYNRGARYLIASQQADGRWSSTPSNIHLADTSFGILFLMRSTKSSIKRAEIFGAGLLVGGQGVPAVGGDLQLQGGSVVVKPLAGPADEILAIMGDADNPKIEQAIAALDAMTFEASTDESKLSIHAEKLKQLAANASPEARAAAVRALARTRNLADVPTLIYALSDEDWKVVQAAHDGLKFASRKLGGFGIIQPATEVDRKRIKQLWTDWYLSIAANENLPIDD